MGIVRARTVRGSINGVRTPRGRLGRATVHRLEAVSGSAILLVTLFILGLCPAPVQAARVHPLEVSETLPNGDTPVAVAVDVATHHLYVVGIDALHSHIYNLDEDGRLDPVHPELMGAPFPAPFWIAVDNSGGAHDGYIYVVNRANLENPIGNVQQFDPAGIATAVTITEAAIPANGTAQAGGLPPVVNKNSFEPRAEAIDGSGNLFVSDASARAIDEFSPAGVFVKQIAAPLAVGFPSGIAVEGGNIYIALGQSDGALSAGLSEIEASTGECIPVGCTPIDPAPISDVAVDQAAGKIFTTGVISEANGSEGRLTEYEAATGDLLGVTHPKALHLPASIAADETSGNVIVTDALPTGEGTVKIFGPEQTLPDVATLTPEVVTDHSVTLRGEIGAAGVAGASCVFQYVDEEEFEENGFEGTLTEPAATAPCEPAGPFSGEAMNAVHADLTGLRGGTAYHERILGTNTNGSNAGEDVPFLSKGPTVAGTEAVAVTEGTATLEGTVDPNGSPTTYRFQYLTQTQFEAGGWAGAIEVPAGGASLGSGITAKPVSAPISGLLPGTTYRLRILAVSTAGTTDGQEVEFTAHQSPFGGLPDRRAYEQVSPIAKNGANIQGAINSVQASLDGERITFFSNAGIPGGEGAQQFPTYLAQRPPAGWSTEGLLPPASSGPRAVILGWSEDLGDTYDFATRAFQEGELLRRQSPGGALTRVGTIESPNNPFAYAGSSQDGGVALLESKAGGLLPGEDLAGRQNVYAYDRANGQLVVAGVMNDGSVPPGGAMAGPYDWFNSKSTSEVGGSMSRYFTQADHAISADGSKVFFTAGGTGQLYVRMNPLAPQSATSGEACTEAAKACTLRITAPEAGVTDPATPAAFLGASIDGRLVYFLDRGKLTTDATGGSGYDLYRYDLTTGTLTDLSLDATNRNGARVEGMLGIGGPTGEDAYFVAAGKLIEGTPQEPVSQAPVGETNLYALNGTALEFVTRLGTGGGDGGEQLDWIPTSRQPNGDPAAHAARVSADGQTLLLRSARKLASYDNHGMAELYLFRVGAGVSCISCNPSGEAPGGSAWVQGIPQLQFSPSRTYSIMTRNLSADGRRVIFDSSDRLVSSDRNDANDVYEWEADGEGSCDATSQDGGCLFLISGGAAGAGPSWFGDADEEGKNVFFFTAQRLVGQDEDELVDVYDARVEGGIASQDPSVTVPCEGEAGCRGAAGPQPPGTPTPGSSGTFPGNPKPPACKKGQVRKHGKCVKKQAHKKSKKSKGKKSGKGKKSKDGNSKKKGGKGKQGGKG